MFAAAATRTALAAASLAALLAISLTGVAGGAPKTDHVDPTVPTDIRVTSTSPSAVVVAWDPSQDNVGIAGYYVFGDGGKATVSGSTYTASRVDCGESLFLTVVAFDPAGNRSDPASATVASAACVDREPPSTPTGFVQQATKLECRRPVLGSVEGQRRRRRVRRVRQARPHRISRTADRDARRARVRLVRHVSAVDAVDAAGNRSLMGCGHRADDRLRRHAASLQASQSGGVRPLGNQPHAQLDTVDGQRLGHRLRLSVSRNAAATVTGTIASAAGLKCGTAYSFSVDAVDAAATGRSPRRRRLRPTRARHRLPRLHPGDTTAPSTPAGLAASSITQTEPHAALERVDRRRRRHRLRRLRARRRQRVDRDDDVERPDRSRLRNGLRVRRRRPRRRRKHVRHAAQLTSPRLHARRRRRRLLPRPAIRPRRRRSLGNLAVASLDTDGRHAHLVASTDNVGVDGLSDVRQRNASVSADPAGGDYLGPHLWHAYRFEVDAYDAAGNRSTRASVIGSTAACPDTQAPTAPTNVVATLANGDEHRAVLDGVDGQRRGRGLRALSRRARRSERAPRRPGSSPASPATRTTRSPSTRTTPAATARARRRSWSRRPRARTRRRPRLRPASPPRTSRRAARRSAGTPRPTTSASPATTSTGTARRWPR